MASSEFHLPGADLSPMRHEGVLPNDLSSAEPVVDGANPLAQAIIQVDLVADLVTAHELRREIEALVAQRLGATAMGEAPASVAMSYREISSDGSATERESSPDEKNLQHRLDTSVRDVFLQAGAEDSWRLDRSVRAMASAGIINLRDALVMGRKGAGHPGETPFNRLRDALAATCPEEEWQLNRDIAQAARICSNLSTVTAGVLPGFWHSVPYGWSVQDVLARPLEEVVVAVFGDPSPKVSDDKRERNTDIANQIRASAQKYARQFFAAQQASRATS